MQKQDAALKQALLACRAGDLLRQLICVHAAMVHALKPLGARWLRLTTEFLAGWLIRFYNEWRAQHLGGGSEESARLELENMQARGIWRHPQDKSIH